MYYYLLKYEYALAIAREMMSPEIQGIDLAADWAWDKLQSYTNHP